MLMVGQIAGTPLFVHTHMVDGGIVTHSHPYSGTSQNPGHGHSVAQFVLIALLSTTVMIAVSTKFSAIITARKALLFAGLFENVRQHSAFRQDLLRGPPVAA